MTENKWMRHPVFDDYAISDDGNVRRLTGGRGAQVGKILRAAVNAAGYRYVNIGGTTRLIHVLVLEAFIGSRPPQGEARHLNDKKYDNRLCNLKWGTHVDNYADRVANGGGNQGSRHGMSKLNESSVTTIRKSFAQDASTYAALASRFNVSEACIRLVVTRQRWSHV